MLYICMALRGASLARIPARIPACTTARTSAITHFYACSYIPRLCPLLCSRPERRQQRAVSSDELSLLRILPRLLLPCFFQHAHHLLRFRLRRCARTHRRIHCCIHSGTNRHRGRLHILRLEGREREGRVGTSLAQDTVPLLQLTQLVTQRDGHLTRPCQRLLILHEFLLCNRHRLPQFQQGRLQPVFTRRALRCLPLTTALLLLSRCNRRSEGGTPSIVVLRPNLPQRLDANRSVHTSCNV
mmetsp:Transcript_17374/g.38990  ORF Transcript_17374/g.38990 Transcript_17374/m.38990 type:complete len:242 (+) Transcript_17374:220-945(+)